MNRIRGGSGAQVRPSRGLGEPTATPSGAEGWASLALDMWTFADHDVECMAYAGVRPDECSCGYTALSARMEAGADKIAAGSIRDADDALINQAVARVKAAFEHGWTCHKRGSRTIATADGLIDAAAYLGDEARASLGNATTDGSQSAGEPREDAQRRATTNSPTITIHPGGKP